LEEIVAPSTMHQCGHCGDAVDMPFACNYCGGTYCEAHRLPEGHVCDGVEFLTGGDRWFRDKASGEVVGSTIAFDAPEPIDLERTVGTAPEPDYESAPDVRTRSGSDGNEESESLVGRTIQKLFRR
jgi:hypothetical protein